MAGVPLTTQLESDVTELASRSQLRMSFLRIALLTVPATVLLGTVSSILSNSGYSNAWFRSLDLPSFMPPGWAFPVAWTILYVLLGLSLAMLIHARGAQGRGRLIGLFLVQMAINYAWSPVFFGMRDPATGLYLVGAMIVLTVALIVLAMRVRPLAAWLMVPYLAGSASPPRSTTAWWSTTRRLHRPDAVPISRSTEFLAGLTRCRPKTACSTIWCACSTARPALSRA
jgi:tryptophan-rich sensory protein